MSLKVLMLLENGPFVNDMRPKREAKVLQEAGYQVSVICPRSSAGSFHQVINGAHVYSFPMPDHQGGILGYLIEYGYSLIAMFILSIIVWIRHGIDIVHAHNPPDILFLIAVFYKLFGKRFVFDHHDLSPELYLARFNHEREDSLYRLLLFFERWTCRLADCVIATNESYREIEMSRDCVPFTKIFIVRNGPDSEVQPISPDPQLRRQASIIIGYVGMMGPQDGLDYLLRALHYLAIELKYPDFYCVLIGNGPVADELRSLAESLGLKEKIWFSGWVSDRTELLSYLSATDICVQPDPSNSLNDVSTMIKTMEYMSLGKPVVAFDLPETRYTGGDAILYAPPNDEREFAHQIARLIDAADLRHELGERGRQRIKNGLTWEHGAANLIQAYNTLDY